jgi:hypothetical protein
MGINHFPPQTNLKWLSCREISNHILYNCIANKVHNDLIKYFANPLSALLFCSGKASRFYTRVRQHCRIRACMFALALRALD